MKFYNTQDADTTSIKSYTDMIKLLEKSDERVSVPVFYSNGIYEWLPIDKVEYLRQLKMMGNPEIPFPCMIEIEPDGEIFFHPKIKNKSVLV